MLAQEERNAWTRLGTERRHRLPAFFINETMQLDQRFGCLAPHAVEHVLTPGVSTSRDVAGLL